MGLPTRSNRKGAFAVDMDQRRKLWAEMERSAKTGQRMNLDNLPKWWEFSMRDGLGVQLVIVWVGLVLLRAMGG